MNRRHVAVSFLLVALACRGPQAISNSGSGAFEASLAPLEDGLAVAWQDNRHGNAEIYFRAVKASGRQAGPARRLTHDDVASYAAEIATLDDQIVVAWYEPRPTSLVARLGSWSRDGQRRWQTTLAREARNPVVATHDGLIFCAWVGGTNVWAGWWDRDGRNVAPAIPVGEAGAATWNLNAVVDRDGTAYIVYDAIVETAAEEIWIARMTADGTTVERLTADDGFASTYPDIAIAGDTAALTWLDERDGNKEVYLKVEPLLDLAENLEIGTLRITDTPGESIGAYIAWNADRLGLTWSDNSSGTYEIFLQVFNETGETLASPTQISHTAAHSLIPAIEPWQRGFALAWNELEISDAPPHSGNALSEIHFVYVP